MGIKIKAHCISLVCPTLGISNKNKAV